MIEIKSVTKIYKDKEREVKAVDDVSLNIKEGEIFGVIGYSGAGKSTLIRMTAKRSIRRTRRNCSGNGQE